jgi:orotidine-5'-phosphate decarboxylase
MIDKLIDEIKLKRNPTCVGLDTMHTYLPEDIRIGSTLESAASAIYGFNKKMIDAVKDLVPSVKIQAAYYEMYGPAGMKAFRDTLTYAKKNGLITIADVKRNDIGTTARAYSNAYLGRIKIKDKELTAYDADFMTVNGYLGTDGILPFVENCVKERKGIFVLVKTSNVSSEEFQDLMFENKPLYMHVAKKVEEWGEELVGNYGYSSVGAVVGATYKEQAKLLRQTHPKLFFLIPGYGAQGAAAQDVAEGFDKYGLGGIVNSSRGILLAYKKPEYAHLSFSEAARAAVIDMQKEITEAINF